MGTSNFVVIVEELLIPKIEATGLSDPLVPVYQIPRRHTSSKDLRYFIDPACQILMTFPITIFINSEPLAHACFVAWTLFCGLALIEQT
jgi:hypothetical protein